MKRPLSSYLPAALLLIALVELVLLIQIGALIFFAGMGPFGGQHARFDDLKAALEDSRVSLGDHRNELLQYAKTSSTANVYPNDGSSDFVDLYHRHNEMIAVFSEDEIIKAAFHVEYGGGGSFRVFFQEPGFEMRSLP